jgi:hypothetical protein
VQVFGGQDLSWCGILYDLMSTAELLMKELEQTPESILLEVYHYLKFLKEHLPEEEFDGLILSESALARDWNSKEEDAAWANL